MGTPGQAAFTLPSSSSSSILQTISRIIKHRGPGSELLFNYVSNGKNDVWGHEDLQERHKCQATYPQTGEGLMVRL